MLTMGETHALTTTNRQTHTNPMHHRVTLCSTTAKFIVGSDLDGVLKPCCEGGYVQKHLREVRKVSIGHI